MITTENVPHLPAWIDLGSPDPMASIDFYRQVFGWTHEKAEPAAGAEQPADMDYWFLRKDGKIVAAVGGLQDPAAKPDWTTYFRVPDAHAAIATAEANGAKVRVPYMEVGPEGAMAALTDPAGAEFAIWQPGTVIGFEKCCEDDSMLWAELWTRDPAAAKAFYPAVFGWKVDAYAGGESEGAGSYDMWTAQPGDPLAAWGGIMPIADELPIQDEKWIPYFMVADADATVARTVEAGGSVLMPAADTPPGRIAALTDQFGARFNILKPNPM